MLSTTGPSQGYLLSHIQRVFRYVKGWVPLEFVLALIVRVCFCYLADEESKLKPRRCLCPRANTRNDHSVLEPVTQGLSARIRTQTKINETRNDHTSLEHAAQELLLKTGLRGHNPPYNNKRSMPQLPKNTPVGRLGMWMWFEGRGGWRWIRVS